MAGKSPAATPPGVSEPKGRRRATRRNGHSTEAEAGLVAEQLAGSVATSVAAADSSAASTLFAGAVQEPEEEEEELEELFAAKTRSPKRITLALCALVLLGVGFLGGMEYQKNYGTSSTSSSASSAAARAAASSSASSAYRSLYAGMLVGTVTNISGDTLYVTESSGTMVEVTTTGATFTETATATINDVMPGDSVEVSGSKEANGSYLARTVFISPESIASAPQGGVVTPRAGTPSSVPSGVPSSVPAGSTTRSTFVSVPASVPAGGTYPSVTGSAGHAG